MLLINGHDKIINHLRWKYFIGEFKPGEKKVLEKLYALIPSAEKSDVREYRLLLDTISDNKNLKDELGVNAYELYSTGANCFVNFKDASNLIMYKVHDLTNAKTLFEDKAKGASLDKVKKALDEDLKSDQAYIKNFAKGYIIYALPEKITDKELNIQTTYKDLGFKSVSYDAKYGTLIIEAN